MKSGRFSKCKRIVVGILLALFAIVVGFIAISNIAYYSPRAADLPCRNCSGEAKLISVNGFDLYFREIGAGSTNTPIVIIHGGPGHSSLSFKNGLDFLASTHPVFYYDQRGSGNSQIKPDPSLYTVDQLVEELESIRKDVVKSEKIILLGHSAGGALVQRYALKYPQHVESMILVSSILINNNVSARIVWDLIGPAFFVVGAGFPPADPLLANDWFTQMMATTSLPRLYDKSKTSLIEDSGNVSFATWREVSRSLEGSDYREALSDLNIRTLVIYGEADAGYTGKTNASLLCTILPECTLASFNRSGHWAFLEEPVKFKEVVMDFLSSK